MSKEQIEYTDWGSFIQMDKRTWNRLVQKLASFKIEVSEVSRKPIRKARTEYGILKDRAKPK